MGTFKLDPAGDPVAFGEYVQDSGMQIGESRELSLEEAAAAFNARRRSRR
jgi:hypothetical protein